MIETVRTLVLQHAKLGIGESELRNDSDLYEAGMSSHASVHVMLALEDEFGVEFPDSLLTRDVFRTVSSIADAIGELTDK